MAHEHHYAARLIWTGAAAGPTRDYRGYSRAYTVEMAGKPPLQGSADQAFRGDPTVHNPEDLLVAALSACHMLTYLALCARAAIVVTSYEDDASGTMALHAGKIRFTQVVLRPRVRIAAGDLAAATALHDEAHAQCFIANSINFPVTNQPSVVTT